MVLLVVKQHIHIQSPWPRLRSRKRSTRCESLEAKNPGSQKRDPKKVGRSSRHSYEKWSISDDLPILSHNYLSKMVIFRDFPWLCEKFNYLGAYLNNWEFNRNLTIKSSQACG